METDALLLSRVQFGFTIAFHILFPSLTIGLASYLAVLEGLWLWRKKDHFLFASFEQPITVLSCVNVSLRKAT